MSDLADWPSRPHDDVSMLDYAVLLAGVGWPVFPCDREKRPLTEHGFYDATTEISVIRSWWSRRPWANLAISTGPSCLAVLDFDLAKGGRESLSDLIKKVGPNVYDTLRVKTGGGGLHCYFSVPSGVALRSSVGELGQGLDIRSIGGYVVAPPSLHISGHRYAFDWETWGRPAPLPDPLMAMLQDTRRAPPPVAGKSPTVYRKGERNSSLASLAGTMRRRGMTVVEISAALHAVNRDRYDPPMTERDVDLIASSVSRYPAPTSQAETATPRLRVREVHRA
jgi:putative DNA primase/helicase